MPETYTLAQDRRSFLRTLSLAGASAALAGCATYRPEGDRAELHLALLSDTHVPAVRENIYRGFKPWFNTQQIAPQVAAIKPAGVILNGDAARLTGQPEDYVELRKLLEPIAAVAPVHIGMGNHDDRANFLNAFTENPGQLAGVTGKHVTVIDHPAVRVVQLDSLLYVDKVAGLLGLAQREWLAAFLAEPDPRPVVLFVHHTLKNGDGDLLDVDRLFEILRPRRQVKAIFYGHSHVWELGEREGVQLINLPAMGYNFNDKDPVGWVESRFQREGVSLKLHTIGGNQADNGKITKVAWAR